jgi:ABC-2 type transport system ATP-binding protein
VEGAIEGHVQGAGGRLLPEIIRLADSQGFRVVDLSVTEPTLETVFINLTGKDLRD